MSRIHFDKRRDFLRGATCLAASGAAATFVPQLSMIGTALAQTVPTGYKALVCIYLSGGNDSWNLLIPSDTTTQIPVVGRTALAPYGPTPYGWYVTSRGGLFQGSGSQLGIPLVGGGTAGQLPNALALQGVPYALNPAAANNAGQATETGLRRMFNQGRLSFIANVGPLVEPVRRQGFNTWKRPPQLYSHNDQTNLWQIGGGANSAQPTGWGGRMAGRLLGTPPGSGLSPCISIAGQTRFLVGEYSGGQPVIPYRLSTNNTNPATLLNNYNSGNLSGTKRREVLESLLNTTYPQAFSNEYGQIVDRSLNLSAGINNAIGALSSDARFSQPQAGNAISFNAAVTAIPTSGLGNQLRQVARMIAVSRPGVSGFNIAANRQVFYVSTGGYDTHDAQIPAAVPGGNGVWGGHQGLLQQVAQALHFFYEAIAVLNNVPGYSGVLNEVMGFTQSEFSRTINSNGSGTDHAWGSVQMVFGRPASEGGPLQGGQVFGRYPLQLLNRTYPSGIDLRGESFNRGEFLPTTAVDQMSATFARWMGVGAADIPVLFPNIGAFTNGAHPNAQVMAYNTQTVPFINV